MEKLDYSDINKFLASLGVVIIGVGIILPYFYLKEDFGLIIRADELAKYSDITKSILSTKESYISFINNWILYLSGIILFIGGGCFYIGIKGWNHRQEMLDMKLKKEIEKIDREVINMTPLTQEETKEKVKNEVQEETKEIEINIPRNSNNILRNHSDRIEDYIRIEKTVAELFRSNGTDDYIIFSQQRIDRRINIDILLQSNKTSLADAIVEIKYLSTLNLMNARRILDNLNTTISYYKNKSGKFTIPILIIVSKNNLDIADINRFKDFIIQYKEGLPDISTMILEVIPENQIQDLKIGTIMSDLYDKSQLHSIHKKMSRIASNLLNSK